MPAARFLVCGRVQGVFYRASTREQAASLGLCGHAKNLPPRLRVEVLAIGDTTALDALEQWLQRGPPAAQVVSVSREDLREDLVEETITPSHAQRFHIR